MRGNVDIRGMRTSPYHTSRKSKNAGAGARTGIASAAHEDWTLGGSRISTGERPAGRGVERPDRFWLAEFSRAGLGPWMWSCFGGFGGKVAVGGGVGRAVWPLVLVRVGELHW
jgi:hypothetical protein